MNDITNFLESKGLAWLRAEKQNGTEQLTKEKIRELIGKKTYDKKIRKTKVVEQLFRNKGGLSVQNMGVFFDSYKLKSWEVNDWQQAIGTLIINLHEDEEEQIYFMFGLKKRDEIELFLEKYYPEYPLAKIFGEQNEVYSEYRIKLEDEITGFLEQVETQYGKRGDLVNPLYKLVQKEMGWKDTSTNLDVVVQNIQRKESI